MLVLDPSVQERLLGRTVRDVLTSRDIAQLKGQRVLVTGAGGSVGAELSRQLAAAGVERLTLVDHSEYALFRIDDEIRRAHPGVAVVTMLCDVTRRSDITAACDAGQPHVVYHAAAYKHVTMAENAVVPAVRVNVIGTAETVRAARAVGARFVLISSDKAAESRSVMGASKRFAELIALSAATETFRPIVLRFGNILGSSGSVAEIMLRCVSDGLAIPITEPDATRYFMTASEAVALVLKADLMGTSPEVFWLDMGEPIRIGDLAARVLEHTASLGYAPVDIKVIGLRPGEKMREELTTQGLSMCATAHARILSATQRHIATGTVHRSLRDLRRACASGDAVSAIQMLTKAVDDYVPSSAAVANAFTASASALAKKDRARAAARAIVSRRKTA